MDPFHKRLGQELWLLVARHGPDFGALYSTHAGCVFLSRFLAICAPFSPFAFFSFLPFFSAFRALSLWADFSILSFFFSHCLCWFFIINAVIHHLMHGSRIFDSSVVRLEVLLIFNGVVLLLRLDIVDSLLDYACTGCFFRLDSHACSISHF